jgi:diguanylate cyclase (GGDEF)-like protein
MVSRIHGQLSVFFIMTFIAATFFYLNPLEYILVLLPGLTVILSLLIPAEKTPLRFSQLVNITITLLFTLSISITVYRMRFRQFLDHLIIESQNRELRRLGGMDGLTGIANRRQLDEMMESDWPRIRGEKRLVSVIMIDVDHFKRYNDSLGHPAGDECLKKIADAITGSLMRNQDYAGRYGGEEFLVVLPDTDKKGAIAVADRITDSIEALRLVHPDTPCGLVTVSQGIATADTEGGTRPEALVALADKALYRAKENGRNRTEIAV